MWFRLMSSSINHHNITLHTKRSISVLTTWLSNTWTYMVNFYYFPKECAVNQFTKPWSLKQLNPSYIHLQLIISSSDGLEFCLGFCVICCLWLLINIKLLFSLFQFWNLFMVLSLVVLLLKLQTSEIASQVCLIVTVTLLLGCWRGTWLHSEVSLPLKHTSKHLHSLCSHYTNIEVLYR